MKQGNNYIDPDDYFSETRMSFGDHIEDLRTHLWRAVKGFFLAVILSFFVGWWVLDFITAPVTAQLEAFYERRLESIKAKIRRDDPEVRMLTEPQFTERFFKVADLEEAFMGLKVNPKSTRLSPDGKTLRLTVGERAIDAFEIARIAEKVAGRRPGLTTLSITEAFIVYFKVCLLTGFVLASPWIFFQIWSFVAAGLYPHEKRLVNVYLPFSIGLFLAGVCLCQFIVMPRAIEALLWFNEWLGLEPDLRLNEWLSFAILMPLVFGISFQTPLIMMFLERIGVFEVESFRSGRRVAWFLMAVFAAIVTPTPDAITMLFLWVPMGLLYELGIGLCLLQPRRPLLDMDVPEPEDMVEV